MPAGDAAATPASRPRLTERHVLALGLAFSGGFVVLAMTAAVAAVVGTGPWWASIHLALAGAATVAIGTFMPHFAVTLAGTRPRPAVERLAGAAGMLVGLGVVARQTVAPLADPLARRHHVVTVTYVTALGLMAVGIALGGLGALGLPAIVAAWASVRPAHVWLTLFGAVSLTIFATLVYLAPTVLGARIRPSRSLFIGVGGLLVGPAITALGFILDARPVALLGMAATFVGALGQIGYVVDVVRRRGPFTSEHDWRRVAAGHLFAGSAWFAAAVGVALAGLLAGDQLRGWSIGLLAIPMIAGWMLQELIGSWTHLVPSVTPGDAAQHARQRRILATASRSRLLAVNLGVGLAWAGGALGIALVTGVGAALLGAAILGSVVLLLRSLTVARY
jgi:hypothetical protein